MDRLKRMEHVEMYYSEDLNILSGFKRDRDRSIKETHLESILPSLP